MKIQKTGTKQPHLHTSTERSHFVAMWGHVGPFGAICQARAGSHMGAAGGSPLEGIEGSRN